MGLPLVAMENKINCVYIIMATPFWSNNPTILFDKTYIYEIIPKSDMRFENKLNAMSRGIILLSLLWFMFTSKTKPIVYGILSLCMIALFYKMRKNSILSSLRSSSEGFSTNQLAKRNQETTTNPVTLETVLKTNYYDLNKRNPLGNVLLNEITDDPNRKPAPPSFNPDVYEDINKSAKKAIQMMNPGIVNTNKQLFGDLWQNYDFENVAMRPFFSTANTKVTNDQGAFAEFLYGGMISGKESNEGGAMARVQDSYRHILM
jgi:hypothetical protein